MTPDPAAITTTFPSDSGPLVGQLLDRIVQDVGPSAGTLLAQAPQGPFGGMGSMIPLLLVGLVFFFLVLRPQQQQEKARKARIDALKVGDEVVTRGGLLGKVHALDDASVVQLQIADRVRVRVLRAEIADVHGEAAADNTATKGPAKATPEPSSETRT